MKRALRTVILVALVASASTAQDAPRGELQVLSYNVHGLPAFVTGDDTLARQRAIGPRLEAFALVALQEDFLEEGHRLLTSGRTHGRALRFSRALSDRVYGSGLSLLSRHRVRAQHEEHYRAFNGVLSAGSDGLASKGFQLARLELAPGVELDVYNTHLDAGGSSRDAAARASQVAQLTSAIHTRSRGRAVLLLGDTNLKASRPRDARTLAELGRATGLRCACRVARARCCGRIDPILVRSGAGLELEVRAWKVERWIDPAGNALSDHAPLRATLRWRRGPL